MDPTKARIKKEISTLIMSCQEAMSGEWDCSTEEGLESFQPMIESLESIAELSEISL